MCHFTDPVSQGTKIKFLKRQLWGMLCLLAVIFVICFINFGSILLPWIAFIPENFLLFLVTDSFFKSLSPFTHIPAICLLGFHGDSECFPFF